ncbi:MAG TPA: DoxX family protein [Blastocatellia bacterium]|nr:DoxX family protein [Blastocatellia bacterium]
MERFLDRYAPYIYAVLRIVAGLMFAMHGAQKLFGWPGAGPTVPLASQMGVAGVIELVGGIMIAIGLLTGFAAFIASGEMAFAYFLAHHPRDPHPILNQGELAALYCFLFLYIASRGAVVWGLDTVLRRRPARTALST